MEVGFACMAGGWRLVAGDWWLEARGQGLGWLVAWGWGCWLAGWLAGWELETAGWGLAWLAGWLTGWLAGCDWLVVTGWLAVTGWGWRLGLAVSGPG